MADVLTPEQRHRNMAAIHSTDTLPEQMLRKALWRKGFRYRKNDAGLIGRPDIVLPKYKLVIFVHGCFWHRHEGCRYATVPKTNVQHWDARFADNVQRDRIVVKKLEDADWTVFIAWECEIRQDVESVVQRIEAITK